LIILPACKTLDQRKSSNFATVCDQMKQGKAWTKLVFDVSKVGPPTYADTLEVAREFVKQAPDRLVWGTNWPHLALQDKPDDAVMFDLLSQVAPDATIRERIPVGNAARLYGF
jgi:D-galactarolactone isomerase